MMHMGARRTGGFESPRTSNVPSRLGGAFGTRTIIKAGTTTQTGAPSGLAAVPRTAVSGLAATPIKASALASANSISASPLSSTHPVSVAAPAAPAPSLVRNAPLSASQVTSNSSSKDFADSDSDDGNTGREHDESVMSTSSAGASTNSLDSHPDAVHHSSSQPTVVTPTTSNVTDMAKNSSFKRNQSSELLDKDSDSLVLAKAAVEKCSEFPLDADQVNANQFIKIKLLGKGAIGKVYLVRLANQDLANGDEPKLYAMKVLTKDEMIKKNKVQRVMTEREVLATTAHPYIVAMYASFQTESKLYYCMEYMAGGEFFRMLQQQPGKRLSEDATRFYAAEVILALQYLHHIGFVYRDLKPENVLMRADGHIALADFDLSKQAKPVQMKVVGNKLSLTDRLKGSLALKKSNSKLNMLKLITAEPVLAGDCKSFVGTEEYLAPEVIEGVNQTAGVDWWTLGVFIYEMLYGETPFRGEEQKETFSNILTKEVKFPAHVPISREAKDLVKRLLTRDPAKRLGAECGASEIMEHKWFADFSFPLIRNMDAPIKPVLAPLNDLAMYEKTMAELDHVLAESGTTAAAGENRFAGFDTLKTHLSA